MIFKFTVNDKYCEINTEDPEAIYLLTTDDDYLTRFITYLIQNDHLVDYGIDKNELLQPSLTIVRLEENAAHGTEVDTLWTAKKSTDTDVKATERLLELRGDAKYVKLFNDKRSVKSSLWQQIASDLISEGYPLPTNLKIAGDKCRQRFSNLQRSYVKYISASQQTGTERTDPPMYFNLMHAILGEKHKVYPPYISDSFDDDSEIPVQPSEEITPETYSAPSTSQTPSPPTSHSPTEETRFSHIKTSVKQKKQSTIDILQKMHKETTDLLKEQFTFMREHMQTDMALRREFLQTFEKLVKQKRKRKRESSSSSD